MSQSANPGVPPAAIKPDPNIQNTEGPRQGQLQALIQNTEGPRQGQLQTTMQHLRKLLLQDHTQPYHPRPQPQAPRCNIKRVQGSLFSQQG